MLTDIQAGIFFGVLTIGRVIVADAFRWLTAVMIHDEVVSRAKKIGLQIITRPSAFFKRLQNTAEFLSHAIFCGAVIAEQSEGVALQTRTV